MKKIFLFLFLIFSGFSFSQTTLEQQKESPEQIKARQEALNQQIAPYLQKYQDEFILATVNDHKILFKDVKTGFINTLKHHIGLLKDKPLTESYAKDYIRQLIERQIMKKVILDQALKLNLSVSDQRVEETLNKVKEENKGHYEQFLASIDLTEETFKETIHNQLLSKEVFDYYDSKVPALTEEELKNTYEKNKPMFKVPRRIRFSTIDIKNADRSGETVEKNRKLVLDLYQRIQNGQSFENLAKNFSDNLENRKNGGDNGYKFIPELDKMYEPLLTVKVNELKMVSFEDGFYIGKLTEDTPEKELSFEEIKEKLKESLTAQRIQQNRAQMMQELMKSSKIEISKGL